MLDEYKKSFDNIITIKLGEHQGAAMARNVGLKKAKGKYVIFLDADDYFYPSFLSKLYVTVENDGSDVCFCGYDVCDSELDIVLFDCVPDSKKCNKEKEDFLLSFPLSPWTKLISREMLLENKIYFQSLTSCNDVYFSVLTMICANKISVLEEKLVNDRTGYTQQISSNRNPMNIWNAFIY